MKKHFFIISTFFLTVILLCGTNPNYDQHESIVAQVCNSKTLNNDIPVCPLGYGKKEVAEFNRDAFSVYSAGILSYSVYEEKISSIGFLGNVFIYSNMKEV